MRDVTDNVTGELEVTVKRGRGRPRKEGALTNAQRQAAYRARRRESVTVTKNVPVSRLVVGQVDAYDALCFEVERLRAELAEARGTIVDLEGYVNGRDRENDHLVEVHDELLAVRRQLELAEAERSKAFAAVGNLQAELAAAKKVAAKSVTPAGNVNAQQFEALLSLLDESCKVRRTESLKRIADAPAWVELVAGDLKLPKGMREALERAVMGQTSDEILAGWDAEKTVTRKAVTKK